MASSDCEGAGSGSEEAGDSRRPDENCYCYGPRELGTVELMCTRCQVWFHKRCLSMKNLKCVPFLVNYAFYCRRCAQSGQETFTPKQTSFTHMCITSLANLTCAHAKQGKTCFSKDKDIIPYIDTHWEGLTSMPRRVKQTWHQTIVKTMTKESHIFTKQLFEDQSIYGGIDYCFGLVDLDLSKIGPNYEAIMSARSLKAREAAMAATRAAAIGQTPQNAGRNAADGNNSIASVTGDGSQDAASSGNQSGSPYLPRTRGGAKRKTDYQSATTTAKRTKGESSFAKLAASGYPVEHPFNRDGYRYYLAEPDEHAPNKQEFDESNEMAGKPIPGYLYRIVRPPMVQLSFNDRAQQMKIGDDRLTVTGEKGYSVVRATHGVSRGCWYYEVTILNQPETTHARIGWSQALACLQAPVGYDKFSYSWRSRKGTRFHDSIGKHYCDGGFGPGDVLGFLIDLPETDSDAGYLPPTGKDLPLIKFKNYFYYEEKDEVQKAAKALKPLKEAKIMFYKNGVSPGVAWTDIYEGIYYPAISLYKNITVRANFGPTFASPPTDVEFRPMCDRAQELLVEQSLADLVYFVENEGKLTLDV